MFMIKSLIVSLSNAYTLIIFVYVLMSWIPTSSGVIADVYRVLGKICDPFLNLFKRIIPPIGMFDISPIVAVIVLQFVVQLLVKLL